MKQWIFLLPLVGILSGCQTFQTSRQRQTNARKQAAYQQSEEQLRRLKGRVESIEMENARMLREIQQLRMDVRTANSSASHLNAAMKSLDAKQAREMKELIRRVESLLKKSLAGNSSRRSSRNRPTHNGPGRIHVVQSGHTLSAIATAYGTTVSAIKRANNLKSDGIRVGQKLFIPE